MIDCRQWASFVAEIQILVSDESVQYERSDCKIDWEISIFTLSLGHSTISILVELLEPAKIASTSEMICRSLKTAPKTLF